MREFKLKDWTREGIVFPDNIFLFPSTLAPWPHLLGKRYEGKISNFFTVIRGQTVKAELVFWTNAQGTSNRNCFIFFKAKQFFPHYIILTWTLSRNRSRTKLIFQKARGSEMYLNVFLMYYCILFGNLIFPLIKLFFWCYSGLTQLSDQNSFPSIFCVEFTDSNSEWPNLKWML